MSYCSESRFASGTGAARVREVIALLGYVRLRGVKLPNGVEAYSWYDDHDYRSFTGVELDLRTDGGEVVVGSRTAAARSHWDLIHQNRTLKLLRDLFGGHFVTDAGKNRYWRPEGNPPSPVEAGCYLARAGFHNAYGPIVTLRGSQTFDGSIAQPEPTGISIIDQLNPRLFSNNLVLPYGIAIWEEYFKATFTALLRYSPSRPAVLERARLAHDVLESIAAGERTVEEALSESLSFQRPSAIAKRFKLLDRKLDVGGALRKPYRRRKLSLFDSIELLVAARNDFVHTGSIHVGFTDQELERALSDLVVAVDRAYRLVARYAGFKPSTDFQ